MTPRRDGYDVLRYIQAFSDAKRKGLEREFERENEKERDDDE